MLLPATWGMDARSPRFREGRSIDTTMGFTPLDGPMMGSRSCSVDPASDMRDILAAVENVTRWIEHRANELLRTRNAGVKRVPFNRAVKASSTHQEDFVLPYVSDLKNVVDMDCMRGAAIKIGVDPLGGAALPYWEPINSIYGLDIEVVNSELDPTFSFMTVDHDGVIRMDCSSPYAMARLVSLKDSFHLAFGNDPDSDRHGIVTPGAGLMNPNHYLAVAIQYLLTHRPHWPKRSVVGKTVVSSTIIDRVVLRLGRQLCEVPVGFKWFVPGLLDGSCCFGSEESAGASFLRQNGEVWTTDTVQSWTCWLPRLPPALGGTLASTTTRSKQSSAYRSTPALMRPPRPRKKAKLQKLSVGAVTASTLAGEPITAKLTHAPGNCAAIGGLKVVSANGWFAARPSGTENIYKIYAESFKDQAHLRAIIDEAQEIVARSLAS